MCYARSCIAGRRRKARLGAVTAGRNYCRSVRVTAVPAAYSATIRPRSCCMTASMPDAPYTGMRAE
jgi:hypothetical protein